MPFRPTITLLSLAVLLSSCSPPAEAPGSKKDAPRPSWAARACADGAGWDDVPDPKTEVDGKDYTIDSKSLTMVDVLCDGRLERCGPDRSSCDSLLTLAFLRSAAERKPDLDVCRNALSEVKLRDGTSVDRACDLLAGSALGDGKAFCRLMEGGDCESFFTGKCGRIAAVDAKDSCRNMAALRAALKASDAGACGGNPVCLAAMRDPSVCGKEAREARFKRVRDELCL